MIRLLELYPDHLNLNGDRGNLIVLKSRFEWAGVDVQLLTHRPGEALPTLAPDLILLGHGSPAAWRQIYADLVNIAPMIQEWLDSATKVLAVSSGFAALHGLISDLPEQVSKVERVSRFEIAESSAGQVVGYRNSDLDLPNLLTQGNLIGTMLHGPLLAKNENFTNELVQQLGAVMKVSEFNLPDGLLRYAEAASKLAIELASE